METGQATANVKLVSRGGQDLLCLESEPVSDRTCAKRGQPTISVISASYGLNRCASYKPPRGKTNSVSKGNATEFVRDACDGKTHCRYLVHWKVIGDPAFGCQKDFEVEWQCNPGGNKKGPIVVCKTGCEAGYGTEVGLRCP